MEVNIKITQATFRRLIICLILFIAIYFMMTFKQIACEWARAVIYKDVSVDKIKLLDEINRSKNPNVVSDSTLIELFKK